MAIKRKIILTGIHSNQKEEMAQGLALALNLNYLSIHAMRQARKPKNISQEYQLKERFINKVNNCSKPLLINCSGTGPTAFLLDDSLCRKRNQKILVFFHPENSHLHAYPYFSFTGSQKISFVSETDLFNKASLFLKE